jgi:hypothetical protein
MLDGCEDELLEAFHPDADLDELQQERLRDQ